jgi:hypothetical protein
MIDLQARQAAIQARLQALLQQIQQQERALEQARIAAMKLAGQLELIADLLGPPDADDGGREPELAMTTGGHEDA